jgi:hypothetical protein
MVKRRYVFPTDAAPCQPELAHTCRKLNANTGAGTPPNGTSGSGWILQKIHGDNSAGLASARSTAALPSKVAGAIVLLGERGLASTS